MRSRRQIIGGLTSVALHAGLLAWAVAHAPVREQATTVPVEIERIELVSRVDQPLALRAAAGAPGEGAASSEPTPGRGAAMRPRPEPAPTRPAATPTQTQAEPPPVEPSPRTRARTTPRRATSEPTPAAEPTPAEPAASPPASITPDARPAPESEPSSLPTPREASGHAPLAGARDGRGSVGASVGATGIDGTPDHSAYGAELVRLVKAEIDTDPVPGLRPRDSIEVVLEVLPSGRLAHRGLGKYDYAQVVRSSLGPVRMRAILRRILRASQSFPPHPSSFPRQRYVLGFTVRFRDLQGHG